MSRRVSKIDFDSARRLVQFRFSFFPSFPDPTPTSPMMDHTGLRRSQTSLYSINLLENCLESPIGGVKKHRIHRERVPSKYDPGSPIAPRPKTCCQRPMKWTQFESEFVLFSGATLLDFSLFLSLCCSRVSDNCPLDNCPLGFR
ncbi:hypothetical protein L1887_17713 [Cichorium endivia]|nr:hypothetical protein L1887_17713 [Cichorium endivia]